MGSELKQVLREKLQQLQPQLQKDSLYKKCVNKYVDTMLIGTRDAITAKFDKAHMREDEFAFPKHKVTLEVGRYGNPQHYIYTLMQQHEETSLLLEVRNGFSYRNNNQLSVMRLNPIYKDLIVEELLNLKMEKNQQLLDDIEQNYTHIIDVDISSMRSFVNNCREVIGTTDKGWAYKNKILKNMATVQLLMTMAHEADASHPHSAYLLERYKTDDCGRIYGEGYSLQRMTAEVRNAALGVCHKYDFKACAFAVMASLAHAIDPTLKIGAVLDYIKNRATIRKRIAAQTGIDEKLVKSIFSAVGFGAKLRNTHFSAIRRELGKYARNRHDKSVWLEKDVWNNLGNEEYERLLANQAFTDIYEDFQKINAAIIKHYSDKELVINDFVYSSIDPNAHKVDKNGKRKKKSDYRTNEQKLAWIYQALETYAREQFELLSGEKALLTTHDCIYFKHKLSSDQVKDITLALQETFAHLRFEYEKIWPITSSEKFEDRFTAEIEGERKHRELIAKQEQVSKTYVSPNNFVQKPVVKVLTDAEYEEQRKQQFMRDVGITEYNVNTFDVATEEYENEYEVDE